MKLKNFKRQTVSPGAGYGASPVIGSIGVSRELKPGECNSRGTSAPAQEADQPPSLLYAQSFQPRLVVQHRTRMEPQGLSRYRIVRKLRSGGMGDVYLAEDTVLPRLVALKTIPADAPGSATLHRRLIREARAASSLTDDHVAHVYDAGEENGTAFIAMEFIEGGSLEERMQREPLAIDEIARMASEIAQALSAAHSRGIVHRDLKPSNVMLTASGAVKVLDFGIARFEEIDPRFAEGGDSLTEPGLVVGTNGYMSPEQALGRPVDPRSDIFSLGVLMYRAVTRRMPFSGQTPAETIQKVMNSQPEPMARFNYDLPVDLERIIRKCLEKEPGRRYQSAKDLLIDLQNFRRDVASGAARSTWITGRSNRFVAGLIVLTLLLLAAAGMTVLLLQKRQFGAQETRSIAVLPFSNNTRNPELDYLSDGLTENIISTLSQLDGVRVLARSTVFQYKNHPAPLDAGKKLGVDHIVTGVLALHGQEISIQAELVDARNGSRIWGARFDRPMAGINDVQNEISTQITRALRPQLDGGSQRDVKRYASADPEAFRLYLKGRFHWNERGAQGLGKAIDYFNQAIEIDPGLALAYTGLADSYTLLELYANVPVSQSRASATAAARKALALDPGLAEAHVSMGSVHETYDWNWEAAGLEYRKGIELSPSSVTAHHWKAMLDARLGRFNEATREIETARALDPLSPIINTAVAHIDYYSGDFEKSVRESRRVLATSPQFVTAYLQLALALTRTGRTDEAAAVVAKARQIAGDTPLVVMAGVYVAACAGESAAVRELLRKIEARSSNEAGNAYGLAMAHAAAGNRDDALEWLARALESRTFWMKNVAVDPAFDELHSDERFKQILASMKLSNVPRRSLGRNPSPRGAVDQVAR